MLTVEYATEFKGQTAPLAEIFQDTGYPDKVGALNWNLLPFSRGSVLISVRVILYCWERDTEGAKAIFSLRTLSPSLRPK